MKALLSPILKLMVILHRKESLLKALKHENIPVNWSTVYWSLQQKLLTNQEVIDYAIDALSAISSAIDKDLVPLASAHASDPNVLQLLRRMLPYDNSVPNYTNESKKLRYAALKQIHTKYTTQDSPPDIKELHFEIHSIYVTYDHADDMYDLVGWICYCCAARLTTASELIHSLDQFLTEQFVEIKNNKQAIEQP